MLAKPPSLTEYLGKRIDEICPFSLGKKQTENHCAHFVSHVMEYDGFAETCKNYTFADKQTAGKGAAIRVNELFNVLAEFGQWANKPLYMTSCLIFATNSRNMKVGECRREMKNGPLKHIGIFIDGGVWHYSKEKNQVVKDPQKIFIDKFTRLYKKGGQVEFFYGRFLK